MDDNMGELRETAAALKGFETSVTQAGKAADSFKTSISTVSGGTVGSGSNILGNLVTMNRTLSSMYFHRH